MEIIYKIVLFLLSEIYLRLPAIQEEEYHEITPELLDVYKDLELLNKLEKGNVTERREGRGFLTKLYFLTGLKLGSLLTSSGTLAASNSIKILGKVFNSALSISYGSAYEDIEPLPEVEEPGVDEPGYGISELGGPELPGGVQTVPNIPVVEVEPKLQNFEQVPNTKILSTVDSKKMFLEHHNKRVSSLNRFMEGKHRTPRLS